MGSLHGQGESTAPAPFHFSFMGRGGALGNRKVVVPFPMLGWGWSDGEEINLSIILGKTNSLHIGPKSTGQACLYLGQSILYGPGLWYLGQSIF